jgi:hypothetical protein
MATYFDERKMALSQKRMKRYLWKLIETNADNQKMLEKCQNLLTKIVCSEAFLCIKMLSYSDGMNIEIKKRLFILIKKIVEDIIILLVNHEEVNPC